MYLSKVIPSMNTARDKNVNGIKCKSGSLKLGMSVAVLILGLTTSVHSASVRDDALWQCVAGQDSTKLMRVLNKINKLKLKDRDQAVGVYQRCLLYKHGVSSCNTLHVAAEMMNTDNKAEQQSAFYIFTLLLNNGPLPKGRSAEWDFVRHTDSAGETAVHYLARCNSGLSRTCMNYLLQRGGDYFMANQYNSKGQKPLDVAKENRCGVPFETLQPYQRTGGSTSMNRVFNSSTSQGMRAAPKKAKPEER